jgi:hypothetical protein
MLQSPHEYVAWMARSGRFSPQAPVAELDPRVWGAYLRAYQAQIGGASDLQILTTTRGLAFYRDPLADDGNYTWALTGPISHPWAPFSIDDLLAAAPTVLSAFADDGIEAPTILTDTFDPQGARDPRTPHEPTPQLLWVCSPRARLYDTFAAYLDSLTCTRRQAARRLLRDFTSERGFHFELSTRPPDAAELDFILEQGALRWGEGAHYALAQALWPIAVAAHRPDQALFCRTYVRGQLNLFNTFIVRGAVLTSQSTTRRVADPHPGLGVAVDLKVIEALIDRRSPLTHLDPTCRTGLDDPPSIEVAKRKVINEPAYQPLLLAGAIPEAHAALPRLGAEGVWRNAGAIQQIGDLP